MRIQFKRWFWRFLGLFGVLLVGTTLYAGYQWHFVFSSYRKIYDYEWQYYHSEVAYWYAMEDAMGQSLKMGFLPHEAGRFVAQWGDKEWTRRLIEGVKSGELEFNSCSDGHIEGTLQTMTNQDLPDEKDAWVAWWEENKDKTQEEWIRDGFEDAGVTVTDELTDELTLELLIILGSLSLQKNEHGENEDEQIEQQETSEDSENIEYDYPTCCSFNAYRWLRDHNFQWQSIRYDDIPEEHREVVFYGMRMYVFLSERCPKDDLYIGECGPLVQGPMKKAGDFGIPLFFCVGLFITVLAWRVLAEKRRLEREGKNCEVAHE
jgi:hypothetical protein